MRIIQALVVRGKVNPPPPHPIRYLRVKAYAIRAKGAFKRELQIF